MFDGGRDCPSDWILFFGVLRLCDWSCYFSSHLGFWFTPGHWDKSEGGGAGDGNSLHPSGLGFECAVSGLLDSDANRFGGLAEDGFSFFCREFADVMDGFVAFVAVAGFLIAGHLVPVGGAWLVDFWVHRGFVCRW